MGDFSKQFAHKKPYKRVRCIDTTGCEMIYQVSYGVINETPTKYHIQFDSKGTKWYSRDRFTEDLHGTLKPKIKKELDNFDTSTLYDLDELGISDFI